MADPLERSSSVYSFLLIPTQNDFLVIFSSVSRVLSDQAEVRSEASGWIASGWLDVDHAAHFRRGDHRHLTELRLLHANIPI